MIDYARFASPLGTILAAAVDGALIRLDFEDAKYAPRVASGWRHAPRAKPFAECERQLAEYFAGKRQRFDLPLAAAGTEFQKRVWAGIARIPYGRTLTYGELAARALAPGSARAAGAATGRNPIAIVVPCHRVVGSDGSLTGYAGGLARKTRLLEIEGVLLFDSAPEGTPEATA
ncbi:MAG TPA: methylated-DNA--[protein]-cysteine S-methyltransferase [Verrucomicrobiae bacterium]|nr:methylated-DNA--[protein]-cysteine S-methyltransferase [Verrucomicrobiae bacterium]